MKRLVRTDFIRPHLSYFTRASLHRLIQDAGFQIIKIQCGRYSARYGLDLLPLRVLDIVADNLGIGGIVAYATKGPVPSRCLSQR